MHPSFWLTALLLAAPAGAVPPGPRSASCAPALERALGALDDTILRLSLHVDELKDRRGRRRLRADLDNTRRAREALQGVACPVVVEAPPLPPPAREPRAPGPPPPPAAELTPPIDERSFGELLGVVRRQSSDDGRLDILETGVRGQCLTSGQVASLLEPFAFAGNKLSAARLLVPRIGDRANAFRLFEAMTFDTDKRKLKEIIDRAQPEPGCCCAVDAPPPAAPRPSGW